MNIQCISNEEWKSALETHPENLAELPMSIIEFESRMDVVLGQYVNEGLGMYRGSAFRLGNYLFIVQGPIETDKIGAIVVILGTESDPKELLQELCSELDIDFERLRNVSDYIDGPKYAVFRLDDNGNELEMERFLSEQSAVSYAEKFTARGHKQTYTVKHIAT